MAKRPKTSEGARRQSGLVVLGVGLFILGVAMLLSPDPLSEPGQDVALIDALWSRPAGLGAVVAGSALMIILLRPKRRGPLA